MDVVIYLQASMRFPVPWQPRSSPTPGKGRHAPAKRTRECHCPRRMIGQVQRGVTVTRGGRDITALSTCSAQPSRLGQLRVFAAQGTSQPHTPGRCLLFPQNSLRAWTNFILHLAKTLGLELQQFAYGCTGRVLESSKLKIPAPERLLHKGTWTGPLCGQGDVGPSTRLLPTEDKSICLLHSLCQGPGATDVTARP